MKIPELLAPVGSIEQVQLAIFSGASSIYLSGKKFGARQYAENLSLKEIKEAVKMAHLYNVKVYVTVNTLIKEKELFKVMEYLLDLYKIGIDAVLVQDIALVKLIREIIPNFHVHASTQMNIQNKEGIKWAVANGIKRVVLPRELNLKEVKEIRSYAHENGVEVETFVHGALCCSYSGRCLFSSFKGGRSGNRGTCAQPCREKYQIAIKTKDKKTNKAKILATSNEEHFLSPKDLSLFNELETLQNIGVDSLKIEGRMRNNEYVAITVNSYRRLLNKLKYSKNLNLNKHSYESKKKRKGYKKSKKRVNKNEFNSFKQDIENKKAIEDLKLVFNREFTTGHILNQKSEEILNTKSPGDSGLYIGKVDSFSKKTGEIAISLESDLITIPEKGDGILIIGKKLISNKNENSYGLEISKNPILIEKSGNNGRKLIIKKVKENKKINIELDKNSKVYLTKRKSISNYVKKLLNDNTKQLIRRSRLYIQFDIGKSNYPILKGKIVLANGTKIDISKKSKIPWEIAKNKPLTKDQLKKQLSKIDGLPIYIEKISINYKEDLFAPISEVNKLRREFFKNLEKKIINSYVPNENELKIVKNNFKRFKKINSKEVFENKELVEINKAMGNQEAVKNNKKNNKSREKSLAIYLNDLIPLKSLNEIGNVFNRIYLEIPPKNQFISFEYNNDKEKMNKIDISYIVNFIKEAIAISHDQKYELIWKWPDIAHQKVIDDFIKALAILKRMNLNINVMTGLLGTSNYLKEKFELELYGSYPLNIYNSISILKLNEYKLLTISPELSKNDISDLIRAYLKSNNYYKKSLSDSNIHAIPEIEILVHGNIEVLVSKKDLISKKQLKNFEKTYNSMGHETKSEYNDEFFPIIKDLKNNEFPIKKGINEKDRILLNSKDLCLINHIPYLKSIGIENFAIDGRWKSFDYIKSVGASYKELINCDNNYQVDLENLRKKSSYFKYTSEGNFIKGLKSK